MTKRYSKNITRFQAQEFVQATILKPLTPYEKGKLISQCLIHAYNEIDIRSLNCLYITVLKQLYSYDTPLFWCVVESLNAFILTENFDEKVQQFHQYFEILLKLLLSKKKSNINMVETVSLAFCSIYRQSRQSLLKKFINFLGINSSIVIDSVTFHEFLKKPEINTIKKFSALVKGYYNLSAKIQRAGHITKISESAFFLNREATNNSNKFYMLKRFSSIIPALSIDSTTGGGFFIHWKGKGFAIDPGYNFCANLAQKGFFISDINAIFLTHAHDDHTADVERIYSGYYKIQKFCSDKKPIPTFGSNAAYRKLKYLFPTSKNFYKIKKNDKTCKEANEALTALGFNIRFETFSAFHPESPIYDYKKVPSGSSLGVGFSLLDGEEKNCRIVFTGDTRYNKILAGQYIRDPIDMLVLNIGNIESDLRYSDKNHLGFMGATQLLSDLLLYKRPPKIALISECGTEWITYRLDLVCWLSSALEILNESYLESAMCILPGDSSLEIDIPSLKIKTNKGTFKDCIEIIPQEAIGSIIYKNRDNRQKEKVQMKIDDGRVERYRRAGAASEPFDARIYLEL